MFISKTLVALFAAVSVSVSVSARVVPRKEAPADWWTGLENYTVYHTRYLALDCQDNHGKPFFDACCHPLLKNQSLSTRPAECTPNVTASISAASAEPTSTEATPDDNDTDEDCDDDEEDESSASPAPSSSTTSSVHTSTHAATSSTKQALAASSTHTSTSKTHAASSTSKAPAASSTSTSGSLITGGFATFFYQGGAAGACGTVHSDSDLIAAIDIERYGNTGATSSLCGKQVKITNTDNSKSVVVTIADACPGCKNSNSIDLSTGAFDKIADESTGEVPISWQFV